MPYYTQNIQTGNASAQSSVETTVQGNGTVSTHIEVEANGEKKVLDSNSPGTYKLEVESGENNQKITPKPTTTLNEEESFESSKAATMSSKLFEKHESNKSSLFPSLINYIRDLLEKLINNFH